MMLTRIPENGNIEIAKYGKKVTGMDERGYEDLKGEIRDARDAYGVSQAAVGSQMGYRPDEFSRVLSGYQPPKGGLDDAEFRAQVRRVIRKAIEQRRATVKAQAS